MDFRLTSASSSEPAKTIRDGQLAITTVVYLAVTAVSLLVLGRLSDYLGRKPVVLTLVFSSIVVLSPVGGALTGSLRAATAIRVGIAAFVIAVTGVLFSLFLGSIGAFLVASLLAGLAAGAATTGAMRALLTGATSPARAGLLSTVYLISYTGAAIPGLAASIFAGSFDLTLVGVGYGCLVLIAGIVALTASRRLAPPGSHGGEQRGRG